MLYTVCYISSSINDQITNNLDEFFDKIKLNNLNHNISGILIYHSKNFFQVLEGEKDEVINLYSTIKADNRHKHIIPVIETHTGERIFNDYATGFEIIDSKHKINQLKDYLNWLKEAELDSVDKVIKIVENFIVRKS